MHHRTKIVEGPYTATARAQVQAGSLWDTEVRATVLAEMQRPPGGGRPRPVSYRFLEVASAHEPTHETSDGPPEDAVAYASD